MPRKLNKKKMLDIVKPIAKSKIVGKTELKKIEKELDEIDKKFEEFEQRGKERLEKDKQSETQPEAKKEKIARDRKIFRPKIYLFVILLAALLAGGAYLAITVLPRAEIKITTQKTGWNYINSIIASKNTAGIDIEQKKIPAEVFSLKKNFNFSFPATGKKMVEKKASGKIIIYNTYSSESQVLVATTRFQAPDGKIFRLTERVLVPGAKIIEGKVVPSSIEAAVIADQPGVQYNIGPVSNFSIPGFQGSAKYQGFYAESKDPMTGGFIGEVAFPTDEDINKAKEKAKADIKNQLDSFLSLEVPPEFKIIEGVKEFTILKEELNKDIDEKGNFSLFLEAESMIIAFKESDLKNLMEDSAKKDLGQDFIIKDYEVEYGAARADFKQGQISFAVDFKGRFEQPINIEELKEKFLKKKEEELKILIFSMSNIEKAEISFWPFWVKQVPANPKRVKIETE